MSSADRSDKKSRRIRNVLIISSILTFVFLIVLTVYYLNQPSPVSKTSISDKEIHVDFILIDYLHPAIHFDSKPPYYFMEKVNGKIQQAIYDNDDTYEINPHATNYYLKVYTIGFGDPLLMNLNETMFANSPYFTNVTSENYTYLFELNKTQIDENLNFSNNGLGIPAYSTFYFYANNTIDTMNCKSLQQYIKDHIAYTNDQLTQLARDRILTTCISSKNMTSENQN